MAIDAGLERIFEAWYDYDHAIDEDAKSDHSHVRAGLIKSVMLKNRASGTVSDFLHVYRERYREWVIRKHGSTPRKRF